MPSTCWSYDADDIRHLLQGVSLWKYRKGQHSPSSNCFSPVRIHSEATPSFPFHPMLSHFRPGSGPRGPMILAALFCREAGSKKHRAKSPVSETTHFCSLLLVRTPFPALQNCRMSLAAKAKASYALIKPSRKFPVESWAPHSGLRPGGQAARNITKGLSFKAKLLSPAH